MYQVAIPRIEQATGLDFGATIRNADVRAGKPGNTGLIAIGFLADQTTAQSAQ